MEVDELNHDRLRAVGRSLFGRLDYAEDQLSNCDTSGLLPDYWLERRIGRGENFQVWEAIRTSASDRVGIYLCERCDTVNSSEVAEKLIAEQADKLDPLARGGSGYASFLVYDLRTVRGDSGELMLRHAGDGDQKRLARGRAPARPFCRVAGDAR